ncbi:MAG: hypothetical protein IH845_00815, partial [Nanoarchaeota archaeon]|nr:hypothetical protein [Nanoarchaeota archaeon]
MDKRGISAVVATVLMILLTIAAIGVIWLSTLNIVDADFKNSNVRVGIISSEGYTFYDPINKTVCVQVTRSSDGGDIEKIRIIFAFDDGNSFSIAVDAPEVNSR